MTHTVIAILIITLSILSIVGYVALRLIMWKKSRPTEFIHNVGIRYLPNSIEDWHGLEFVINELTKQISQKYGSQFTEMLMSNLIIVIICKIIMQY